MIAAFLLLAAATQFDLVCTELRTAVLLRTGETVTLEADTPKTERLRVSLSDRRWCDGECNVTHPLKETEDVLILDDTVDKAMEYLASDRINRRMGRRWKVLGDLKTPPKFNSSVEYACEAGPFSGFAKRKF